MKNKISGQTLGYLLGLLFLFDFSVSKAQTAKTTMLVYQSGAVIFERDIAEIDSVKFYPSNSATLSVPLEEMFVYRYGTIYFRRDIAEIDSVTFFKTSEISPLIVTGTITPSLMQGCLTADAPAAVTTIAELESLPGSLTINEGCSGKDKMIVSHSDVVSGSCPIKINRIYTIKDACNNSATVVHQIAVEDSENPVISGTLADVTVTGSSEASAPSAALSVGALEALPGSIQVNDNCTTKNNLTIDHTDEVTGACPLKIKRTYTLKDVCQNSASVVQQIIIEPIAPITTVAVEYIKGGTFIMGSPDSEVKLPEAEIIDETQHQVTLSSFYMSKYEVSNGEYATFLNSKNIGADAIYRQGLFPDKALINNNNPETRFEPWGVYYSGGRWIPYPGFENNPIVFVTWYGAVEYAKYAGGRLPTEAEFEYACRAGTTTPFYTGYCITDLQANYDWRNPYNGCSNTRPFVRWHTEPVNSYQPNAWGLYNMHGNISEWCSDWFGAYPSTAQINPTGSVTGTTRMLRGGTNSNIAYALRSAYRYAKTPEYASSTIGFRIVFDCTSFN